MRKKSIFFTYIGVAVFSISAVGDWSDVWSALQTNDWKEIAEKLVTALDSGSAVALALLAGFAFWGSKRDDEWITVVIHYPDGREKRLYNAFQRESCSRRELQGVLGDHHGLGRYDIQFMRSPALMDEIRRIKMGRDLELRIPLGPLDRFRDMVPLVDPDDHRPLAFLNLSNHPSVQWSDLQLSTARELTKNQSATIIDYPFPHIDPELSSIEIEQLADQLLDDLTTLMHEGDDRIVAVHIAGEPIMCLAISRGLRTRGVKCYSATSHRLSTEEDGVKRSEFHFVRFREWI